MVWKCLTLYFVTLTIVKNEVYSVKIRQIQFRDNCVEIIYLHFIYGSQFLFNCRFPTLF